jgi:hypothetical protein
MTRFLRWTWWQARLAYETGVGLVRGLFVDWPGYDEAYAFDNEYSFGSSFVAAPVVEPVSNDTLLAPSSGWIPPGQWADLFTGQVFLGPMNMTRWATLEEIPVFLQAGVPVPFSPLDPDLNLDQSASSLGRAARGIGSVLGFRVWAPRAGVSTTGRVYDDDGVSNGYTADEFVTIEAAVQVSDDGATVTVTVGGAQGGYPGMPESREYVIELVDVWPPSEVTLRSQGAAAGSVSVPYHRLHRSGDGPQWTFDGERMAVRVLIGCVRLQIGSSWLYGLLTFSSFVRPFVATSLQEAACGVVVQR